MEKVTTGIQKGKVKETQSGSVAASLKSTIVQRNESLHDAEKEKRLDSMAVQEKNKSLLATEKAPWCIYDCHLHFLDFLQKSSGSSTVLEDTRCHRGREAGACGVHVHAPWLVFRSRGGASLGEE